MTDDPISHDVSSAQGPPPSPPEKTWTTSELLALLDRHEPLPPFEGFENENFNTGQIRRIMHKTVDGIRRDILAREAAR